MADKKEGKVGITDLIAILALIVSIIFPTFNLIRSCNQEGKIDELNYNLKSVKFQPRLQILNKPEITKVWVDETKWEEIDKIPLKTKPGKFMSIIRPHLKSKFHIKSKIKLINIGNTLGRIIFYGSTDTLVGNFQNMTEISSYIYKNPSFRLPEFFSNELLPNSIDSTEIYFENLINNIEEGIFNIHYIILYENELGQIYHTYFKSKYQMKEVGGAVKDGRANLTIHRDDFVGIEKTKPSYYSYKRSELFVLKEQLKFIN